jgi:hypothetical protein
MGTSKHTRLPITLCLLVGGLLGLTACYPPIPRTDGRIVPLTGAASPSLFNPIAPDLVPQSNWLSQSPLQKPAWLRTRRS